VYLYFPHPTFFVTHLRIYGKYEYTYVCMYICMCVYVCIMYVCMYILIVAYNVYIEMPPVPNLSHSPPLDVLTNFKHLWHSVSESVAIPVLWSQYLRSTQ